MKKIALYLMLLSLGLLSPQQRQDEKPAKVLHTEPLYVDLIRDLGTHKGEREWNLGLGLTDNLRFDCYEALIEYEWAPANRLGLEVDYEINTGFHYMVPGTDNFLGVELNKGFQHGDFDMTIRPQMPLDIAEEFLIGIVAGIPISRENQRFSAFMRLFYEPLAY